MFAALTVPRLIEAVHAAPASHNLPTTPSWRSPDDVAPQDLPLAQAVQKVLASMQSVLAQTAATCTSKMASYDAQTDRGGAGEQLQKKRHLALMNASEVVVPRHVAALLDPPHLERFRPRAVAIREQREVKKQGDELGVLHLGIGQEGGAVQVETPERDTTTTQVESQPQTQSQDAKDADKAGESIED